MTLTREYKNGIVLSTIAGVGVPVDENAPFWNLSDAEKIELLKEARVMCLSLMQCEEFDYMHRSHSIFLIDDETPRRMVLLSEMKNNSFAEDNEKILANDILQDLQEAIAGLSHKRTPRASLRNDVIERDKSKCRYCGVTLTGREIHIDHVVPYSLGGLTEKSNLVVSCRKCNMKKFDKALEESGMSLLPLNG